jgi:dUTPase
VVKLYKLGGEPYQIKKGDKISQILIMPISDVNKLEETTPDDFYSIETERGDNGFGSTDTRKE